MNDPPSGGLSVYVISCSAGGALIVLSHVQLRRCGFGTRPWHRPAAVDAGTNGRPPGGASVLTGLLAWWVRRRLPATAEVLAVLVVGLARPRRLARLATRRLRCRCRPAAWWSVGFALAGAISILGGIAGFRRLHVLAPMLFSATAGLCISLASTSWRRAVVAAGISVAFAAAAPRATLATPDWMAAAVVCLMAATGFAVTGLVLGISGIATAKRTAQALGPAVAMVALGGGIAIAGVLLHEQIASYPPLADVLVGLTTLASPGRGVPGDPGDFGPCSPDRDGCCGGVRGHRWPCHASEARTGRCGRGRVGARRGTGRG